MLNGEGLRVVLWMAGCSHGCKDCQNPLTWDPQGGILFDEASKKEIFDQLEFTHIDGITFSGGDPLHANNIVETTELAKEIRTRYPYKTIWLYTGALWEEIDTEEVVRYVDVVIDGKFEIDKLDRSLNWRGSSNQRVINAIETLKCGKIVLWDE